MRTRGLVPCLACMLLALLSSAAAAQTPLVPPAPPPDAQQEPAAAQPTQTATDPEPEEAAVAPDSPRASLRAFLDATGAARWDEAARYLSLPDDQRSRGAELAERFWAVLERHVFFDLAEISPLAEGRLDDGLAPSVEQIAELDIGGATTPIRVIRVTDDRGSYWAFSGNVVRQIDGWYGTLEGRWIMDWLVRLGLDELLASGPFDIMWWQWIGLLVVIVVAWIAGPLLGRLTRGVLRRLTARTVNGWDDQLITSIGPPISVGFTLLIVGILGRKLGLPVGAERAIGGFVRGAAVATFFWALWRSVNVWRSVLLSRPWAVDSPSARTLLTLGGNLLKGIVVAFGILALVSAFGYPVTTVLAGLGIGGLALAFGAQKTVENLFGSMALAADQPFRVGDFVKVQDFVGTVEDIGLRSTRIRTLDRTVISIPNGSLADQRLESFTARDRMRLATTIGVEYGTTHAQMTQVLEGFERVLREHPKIWSEAMVVKFAQFGASSLDIEIMAWFEVPTWGDFQLCRQEVLLGFMKVVEDAGTAFAFPTQTIHLINDTERDGAAADAPQEAVARS